MLNQLDEGVFIIEEQTGFLHFLNKAAMHFNIFMNTSSVMSLAEGIGSNSSNSNMCKF